MEGEGEGGVSLNFSVKKKDKQKAKVCDRLCFRSEIHIETADERLKK